MEVEVVRSVHSLLKSGSAGHCRPRHHTSPPPGRACQRVPRPREAHITDIHIMGKNKKASRKPGGGQGNTTDAQSSSAASGGARRRRDFGFAGQTGRGANLGIEQPPRVVISDALRASRDRQNRHFVEATELFQSAIRCGKHGDMHNATAQLATAFLLSERAISICGGDEWHDDRLAAVNLIRMIEYVGDEHSAAGTMLEILVGTMVGPSMAMMSGSSADEATMNTIAQIDSQIRWIERQPAIEGVDGKERDHSVPLGATFRRSRLHELRSSLFMRLGDLRRAESALTEAIRLASNRDDRLNLRLLRASLWGAQNMREKPKQFEEFKACADGLHEDNRGHTSCSAWLALLIFESASLGTYRDAVTWLSKMHESMRRQAVLYGESTEAKREEMRGSIIGKVLRIFPREDGGEADGEAAISRALGRKLLDVSVATGIDPEQLGFERREVDGDAAARPTRVLLECAMCGKVGSESSKTGHAISLRRCGQCRMVAYCSVECQKADWAEHKSMCKQAKKIEKARAKEEEKRMESESKGASSSSASSTLREKAEEDPEPPSHGSDMRLQQAQALSRMEARLQADWATHNRHIAEWWHRKSIRERKKLLSILTADTMPDKLPSPDQVKAIFASDDGTGAGVLFDWSLETLVEKSCACGRGPGCGEHHFTDRLLHELFHRASDPSVFADCPECSPRETDYAMCYQMQELGIFEKNPALEHCQYTKLDSDEATMKQGMMRINVERLRSGQVTGPNGVPRSFEQHMAIIKQMAMPGHNLFDASAFHHAHNRRLKAVSLLTLVVDEFFESEKHMPTAHPFARLNGCNHCHASCARNCAVVCKACELTWWCCARCQAADYTHDANCLGDDARNAVAFGRREGLCSY